MWDAMSILFEAGTPLRVSLYLHSYFGGPTGVEEWFSTGSHVIWDQWPHFSSLPRAVGRSSQNPS